MALTERITLQLPGTINQINAFRRSLISEVSMIAPSKVEIRRNTTAMTDEFLAQRIGLIPFVQDDTIDPKTLKASLKVSGRNATTNDILGVDVAYKDVEIAVIDHNQELDLDVFFTRGTSGTHAQFARVCAVSMFPSGKPGVQTVAFTPLIPNDGHVCVSEAWNALSGMIDTAFAALEKS